MLMMPTMSVSTDSTSLPSLETSSPVPESTSLVTLITTVTRSIRSETDGPPSDKMESPPEELTKLLLSSDSLNYSS